MKLTAEQQALLAERLRGRGTRSTTSIPTAPDGPAGVSAEQLQIVWHTWLAPGDLLYNECVTLTHRGDLDVAALRIALSALIARHSMWRTTFRRSRHGVQQMVAESSAVELPVHDMRSAAPGALEELLAEVVLRPYDLREGPLVRPALVRVADDEHRLYLAMHHLVFDGVSMYRIVLPELAALYDAAVAGEEPGEVLPPVVQYRDYAVWQAGGPLDEELSRHLPWWRRHLDGAPTLALPLRRPRSAEPSHRGATTWLRLEPALVDAARHASQRRGATLFHLLAAAHALLLQELTGQNEVVFGTVVDRRRRSELEPMVGYCLTPLPVRVRLPGSGDPPGILVDRVREELLDVLAHNVPFERIVADLNPAHPVGANPVFQSMVVLEPYVPPAHAHWSIRQLDPRMGGLTGHAKSDVHLELDEGPDGSVAGRFIVSSEVFEPDFGSACAASFRRFVERLADSAAA